MNAPSDTRHCKHCDQTLPLTPEYFYRNKTQTKGFDRICKQCKKTICREYHRIYELNRRKNPEVKAHEHEYRKKDRLVNPDKYRLRERKRQRGKYQKEYRRKHKSQVKSWEYNRRARKRENGGVLTDNDIQNQFRRQKGQCYYCHQKLDGNFQVDHVIPVSRGGRNDPSNIVVTCPHCNTSKQDKLPHEWPEGGRLL